MIIISKSELCANKVIPSFIHPLNLILKSGSVYLFQVMIFWGELTSHDYTL